MRQRRSRARYVHYDRSLAPHREVLRRNMVWCKTLGRTTRHSWPRRVGLPPQQSPEHLVDISGQIRLTDVGGRWLGTHHEQATAREAGKA